jgi:hypothetical protein
MRAALARDKRSVSAVEDAVDANSLALDAANARIDNLLAASWKHPCAIFSLLGVAAMAFLAAYASIRFLPRPPLRASVRPASTGSRARSTLPHIFSTKEAPTPPPQADTPRAIADTELPVAKETVSVDAEL